MNTSSRITERERSVWLKAGARDFKEFCDMVGRTTDPARWPLACGVEKNVLIYASDEIRAPAQSVISRNELMAEWAEAFSSGRV